jgi:hypothetical protein
MGRPARVGRIKQTVQEILMRNAPDLTDPPILSRMWAHRYIKRLQSDLYKVKQKVIGRKQFEASFNKNQFIN